MTADSDSPSICSISGKEAMPFCTRRKPLVRVGHWASLMPLVGTFARAIQRELRTIGHRFANRYYASLVDVNSYFLELLRYIHLNPVRARIVPTAQCQPLTSLPPMARRL
jgi:hypothetical protein